jgi:hypothetical protein
MSKQKILILKVIQKFLYITIKLNIFKGYNYDQF